MTQPTLFPDNDTPRVALPFHRFYAFIQGTPKQIRIARSIRQQLLTTYRERGPTPNPYYCDVLRSITDAAWFLDPSLEHGISPDHWPRVDQLDPNCLVK